MVVAVDAAVNAKSSPVPTFEVAVAVELIEVEQVPNVLSAHDLTTAPVIAACTSR